MPTLTIPEFKEYLLDRVSKGSAKVYLSALRALWTPSDEPLPPAETLARLRARTNALTPKGSVQPRLAAVAHWFRAHAEPEPANWLPGTRFTQSVFREALTPDEYETYKEMVSGLPHPYNEIARILPMTCMRISEVCGLRIEHTHLDVDKPYVRFIGKGGAAEEVPLIPSAVEILETCVGNEVEGYVFPGRREGTHIHPASVQKHFRRIREGRPGRLGTLTPHILRHTGATMLLRNGVPVSVVQRIMRHADITTTVRYLHASDEDQYAALMTLDESVGDGD